MVEPDPYGMCFGFGRRFGLVLRSLSSRISDTNFPGSVQVPCMIYRDQRREALMPPGGIHLADLSVFISCAMSLAVFDISKYVENGVVIEPVYGCQARRH
jgi:hypothetical protein